MKRIIIVSILLFLVVPIMAFAQGEVIYKIDGMDEVTVQNVEYRVVDDTSLTMDVYYPPDMEESGLPVVILVNGFRDSRISQFIGSDFKDNPTYISWARLIAASGLIAVTHDSEQPDDLEVLVTYIRDNEELLHIDGDRIGLMASSSHPPTAISYAMQSDHKHIKAAVFYYGSMITPDGQFTEEIDRECRQFGCYGPSEVAPIEQLRRDLPTLVVRAGFDNGENPSIDHYVIQSLESNVPLTVINFPLGRHGFDSIDAQIALAEAQEIVAFTVDYMIYHLSAE